jgi:hypothetical protein
MIDASADRLDITLLQRLLDDIAWSHQSHALVPPQEAGAGFNLPRNRIARTHRLPDARTESANPFLSTSRISP